MPVLALAAVGKHMEISSIVKVSFSFYLYLILNSELLIQNPY